MQRFRAATPVDADRIVELMRMYYAEDGYPFSESSARSALAEFLANPELGRLWVAELDGEIAGYMAVTLGFSFEFRGRDAFLDEIYIDAPARRRGLGREAIDIALAYCRENSVRAIHLEVEDHREAARRLYGQLGFESHGRSLLSKSL